MFVYILLNRETGDQFHLKEGTHRVGRLCSENSSDKVTIKVSSIYCSKIHCDIELYKDRIFVTDYSVNGTTINKEYTIFGDTVEIRDKSVLHFGTTKGMGFIIYKKEENEDYRYL